MICPRCQGLMEEEGLCDLGGGDRTAPTHGAA